MEIHCAFSYLDDRNLYNRTTVLSHSAFQQRYVDNGESNRTICYGIHSCGGRGRRWLRKKPRTAGTSLPCVITLTFSTFSSRLQFGRTSDRRKIARRPRRRRWRIDRENNNRRILGLVFHAIDRLIRQNKRSLFVGTRPADDWLRAESEKYEPQNLESTASSSFWFVTVRRLSARLYTTSRLALFRSYFFLVIFAYYKTPRVLLLLPVAAASTK